MKLLSQEALARIVQDELPRDAVPGEKVVLGTLDDRGAKVVASFKAMPKPDARHQFTWEAQAEVHHEWSGDNGAGAKVLLRWR